MTYHWNSLCKTVLMSGHNLFVSKNKKKNVFESELQIKGGIEDFSIKTHVVTPH